MRRCQKKLGEMLLEGKVIKAYQLELALKLQKRWGGKLASILIEMGSVDEKTIATFLAKHLGQKCIAFENVQISPKVLKMVKYEIAQRYQIIPLNFKDDELTIAISNTIDCKTIDELSFVTGFNRIKTIFAIETCIANAIQRFYLGKTLKTLIYI